MREAGRRSALREFRGGKTQAEALAVAEAEAEAAIQRGVRADAEQAALDFREKYAKEIAEDPELIDVFWQSVRLSAEED